MCVARPSEQVEVFHTQKAATRQAAVDPVSPSGSKASAITGDHGTTGPRRSLSDASSMSYLLRRERSVHDARTNIRNLQRQEKACREAWPHWAGTLRQVWG